MQLVVKVAPPVAAALRQGQGRGAPGLPVPPPPEAVALQNTANALGISLVPQHPSIPDPELSTYFTAEVDAAAAPRVLAELAAAPGVEGAFPAAHAEPAG